MTIREMGKMTGSRMTVNISGSGRVWLRAQVNEERPLVKRTEEFVRDLTQVFLCLN
jgi:hypothetical protein